MNDEYAIVGRIRKPHGIHGELVVELTCDAPDAIFAAGRHVFAGNASGELPSHPRVPAEITRARPFKEGMLVTLAGVGDRNEADNWRGRYLFVPMAELAPPGEGEVWLHELAGMRVREVSGTEVGVVEGVQEVPQGLLLDVRTPRALVSVPFVEAIVTGVDRDARVITIDPPAGLMEL